MNDIKSIIEDVEKSDLVSDKVIKRIIEIIGQEKWQDIHDEESDICTTTGELIITLKGVSYLEKENAEQKELLDAIDKAGEHVRQQINDAFRNKKPYWEVEKENAELKSKSCWKTCEYVEPKSQWIGQHIQDVVQLTETKEILVKLLEEEKNNMYWEMNGSDKSSYYEVRKQAEQFLEKVK